MQPKKRAALGRGLEALLPPTKPVKPPAEGAAPAGALAEKPTLLPIDKIEPNPDQPRQSFYPDALQELADSLKQHGFIQPLAVMPSREAGKYKIVAGERRWRAAQLAGIKEVPVILMEGLSDQEVLELALVENLQRQDLNAIEEAEAYQALQDVFHLTTEQIAERVGKSRSAVANTLRLTKLHIDFIRDIQAGYLSGGHARALLMVNSLTHQYILRNQILSEDMTVRQAETRAAEMMEKLGGRQGRAKNASKKEPDQELVNLRNALVDALAVRVEVKRTGPTSGKVEIHYESLDDLQVMLDKLNVEI